MIELLITEMKDPYIRENFRRLKLILKELNGQLGGSGDNITNIINGLVQAGKDQVLVDSAFLATPVVNLSLNPILNSDSVTLNGLEIDNTNYSIVGNVLTMNVTQIEIGDNIYINYIGY